MSDTTIPQMPKAPECDRMLEVADDSHKIGEFLDWLQQQGIHLASYVDDGHHVDEVLMTRSESSLGPRDYEACG